MKDKLARWHEIERRMPKDKRIDGIEVGVWQGKCASELLARLPHLRLTLVDRWCVPPAGDSYVGSGAKISTYGQEKHDEAYRLTINRVQPYFNRVRVLKMDSDSAAKLIIAEGALYDFVFIDGDHSYLGVKKDIEMWRGLVKPGGLLCGHDYSADPAKKGEVKRAVDEVFPSGVKTGANSTWFVRL